jgi:endonuclease/exonuclease/phosphatase family metal-dependent hydrolase
MRMVLVTWNLKGSANPDVAGIADHIRRQGADVVALQEVQWHQARRIARALGTRSRHWSVKHWPVRTWPEGMAVIGVTRPVRVRTRALSYRWRLWSWRRRIAQVATIGSDGVVGVVGVGGSRGTSTGDGPVTLLNVHLTPHGRAGLREVETATVLALASRPGPVVVAGDLNERPGRGIHFQLAAAGLRDGWAEPPVAAQDALVPAAPAGPAPTNWRGWRRGTTEEPVQTLDYVYVSPAVTAVAVRAPRVGDDGFARFAGLSDHLPVTAVLDIP